MSMNWISFAERKPKAEPKRQIRVKYKGVEFTPYTDELPAYEEASHWAEIEAPPKPEAARELDSDSVGKLCSDLVEIVEGVGSLRWSADGGGLRLKDTKEWAKFYVAVSKLFRNRSKLEAETEGPGDSVRPAIFDPEHYPEDAAMPKPDPFEQWYDSRPGRRDTDYDIAS